jgi:delta-aminolevulinic acid dehydratase/porphobilinogen synthase
MPYLDVIHRLRLASNLPIAAYHVSGEYAMLKAAAQKVSFVLTHLSLSKCLFATLGLVG